MSGMSVWKKSSKAYARTCGVVHIWCAGRCAQSGRCKVR